MSNAPIIKSQKINNNKKEEMNLTLIQSVNDINIEKYWKWCIRTLDRTLSL